MRIRLTDVVFGRMVVDVRSLLDAMPSELKDDIDGDFLTAIAEQPNEILKYAMYLFLGISTEQLNTLVSRVGT